MLPSSATAPRLCCMRPLDFLFALRPLVLVPAWSFFVLGHAAADYNGRPFPLLRFVLFTACLAGVYLVNQIADRESDRINGKGFFLQHGIFSVRTYALAATLLLTASLVAAWGANGLLPWLLLVAVLGLAYSLPPVRLCARPGVDLMANALGYGALAMCIGAGGTQLPVVVVAAGMTTVAAVFLHTTLLDVEGDVRTHKHTTGLLLGPRRARLLAAVLGLVALGLAIATGRWVWIAACGMVAFLAAAALTVPRVTSQVVVVGSTVGFALAAALAQPAFGVALVPLVLATRLYYRRRFSVAYPW